jgi:hypothetical protein
MRCETKNGKMAWAVRCLFAWRLYSSARIIYCSLNTEYNEINESKEFPMSLPAVQKESIPWDEFCAKAADEERVVFEYRGKKLALLSAEDLDYLETLEDRYDNELADAALSESDEIIPYEQVRKELGLI